MNGVVVAFNPETHLVVERAEVDAINRVFAQAALVMVLAEREPGATDSLAFEAGALRAMFQEHFTQVELPAAPE